MAFHKRKLLLALLTTLTGCGGGGGGAPAAVQPPPPPATFTIGGSISGLLGDINLQNNNGDDLTVSADGSFTFAGAITDGNNYAVTILTQPAGQACSVSQGSGTVGGGNVVSVVIQCAPAAPVLTMIGRQVKMFRFTWVDVTGETQYRLLEDVDGTSGFFLRGTLAADSAQADIEVFVPERANARYMVQACDANGCVDSNIVEAMVATDAAVGYVKASNANSFDQFGATLGTALSADGSTLAVGAPAEDSNATSINGDATDNSASNSGAVFVYVRIGPGAWALQAYIKAANAEPGDLFGGSVDLSNDGNTLVVSAGSEDSSATGSNGNGADNSAPSSGAAYVFVRDGLGDWSQQAYIKASNTATNYQFGWSAALSGDGDTLAVGSVTEPSGATGVNGNALDNSMPGAGAAYVYVRDSTNVWSQQAYIKASNPDVEDRFGWDVSLTGDGSTLAVGAIREDGDANGINGDGSDNLAPESGAAYLFVRDNAGNWAQQAYLKSSNSDTGDFFGLAVELSDDSSTLVVAAYREFSNTMGINGDQADNSTSGAGAVYVFDNDGLGTWSQQAYIKPSNTGADDSFGWSIGLSGDGSKLIVGAPDEDSVSVGIDGDQFSDTAGESGAAYLFSRDGTGVWQQMNYLKAPNSDAMDVFSESVAISDDGQTMAIGSRGEDSAAGPGGDQTDNSELSSGAVYIY